MEGTWLIQHGSRLPHWFTQSGSLRVDVHTHLNFPGRFCVSCPRLGIEVIPLTATEPEAAKAEAIAKVRADIHSLARLAERLPAPASAPTEKG